ARQDRRRRAADPRGRRAGRRRRRLLHPRRHHRGAEGWCDQGWDQGLVRDSLASGLFQVNVPVTDPSYPHHTPPIRFPDSTSGGTMTCRKWLAAFFLVATWAATAFAQVDQGRFTGTVRDQ